MGKPIEPPNTGDLRSETPAPGRGLSGEQEPASVAHAIYDATVKELKASQDPSLQREVLRHLEEMLRGGDRDRAQVTSAVALTPDERRALEQKLRAKFGRDLVFEYRLDPGLLGGVVAKVGDKIIDGSLAARLNAMQAALLGAR
jgi:hypothetical protein